MNEAFLKNNKFNGLFFCSAFIGIFFITFKLDSDGWFLLNGGRYVLTHGIPYIEPFTIHENLHFVMQQWLTGVVFWSIYSNFGLEGLLLLIYVIFAVMVVVLYRLCMLISNDNFQMSVIVTTIAGIFISFFMVTRPQIFSALILLVTIYCMELYVQRKRVRYLIALPILSLLLINVHASLWPMLFVVMIPYLIDSFPFKFKVLCGEGYRNRPLFLCLVIMFFAGFVNPYGLKSMTYLFTSYGYEQINSYVREMNPLIITNLFGKIGFCMIILTFFTYTQRKVKLRYLLLSLGTAYMAMSSVRSLFLFFLCGLFPLAYAYRDCLPLKSNDIKPTAQVYRLRKILTVLLGCAVVFTFYQVRQDIIRQISLAPLWAILLFAGIMISFMMYSVYQEWQCRKVKEKLTKDQWLRHIAIMLFGVAISILLIIQVAGYRETSKELTSKPAIDYLLEKNQAADIVLWTNYNTGQYPEFRGVKCYMDARADVFLLKNNKQKDILDEYFAVRSGKLYYKEFIERYHFTHFLTAKIDILYTYLYHDPDYNLIFEDENYRLYEQK